jgi:hypothetical protein
MKLKSLAVIAMVSLMFCSCSDDDGVFVQVKSNEDLLYRSIKAYREDNGLSGPFVHQYLMVKEAQLYSYKMACGLEPFGTQGLAEHWSTIHGKIGGYNDQALVLATASSDEDEILSQMLQQPGADSILLEDLTQCGVGIEPDTSGTSYVTVLLMKVD